MTAYYNEIDPYAAQWLRNLIAAGHIAPGVVDERPIQEVEAFELVGFTQCHFFAGIGIWSKALRDAGWPDDRPIWTGSCPCQPFSNAGQKKGFSDDRHLWPYWYRLISERSPPIIIGEQVASALAWLDLVSVDLERAGYAYAASDLCAAGFDGAHIRQRLYFAGVDNAMRAGVWRDDRSAPSTEEKSERTRCADGDYLGIQPFSTSAIIGMANGDDAGSQGRRGVSERADQCVVGKGGMVSRMADAFISTGQSSKSRTIERIVPGSNEESAAGANPPMLGRTAVDWLACRDGKWRPVEPGAFPLADAAPQRVGRLRAYGNGLDLETATQFCAALSDVLAGV